MRSYLISSEKSLARFTIGYFDDSVTHAGTTRYLCELLSRLPRDTYTPVFMAPISREWHADITALGVEVVTLHPGTEPIQLAGSNFQQSQPHRSRRVLPVPVAWSLGLVNEVRGLSRLFGSRPVDILHSNNAGQEPAPIAARRAKVPRILATLHVSPLSDIDSLRGAWRYRVLERRSMRSLDAAIAVSNATADEWAKRCRLSADWMRKVRVIYNGIDPGRFRRSMDVRSAQMKLGIAANGPVVGAVGRMVRLKGYEYLLRAVASPSLQNVRLVLAGDGPERAALERMAQNLGIAGRVTFPGHVSDPSSILQALDVYCHPSLSEAHPLALLEAFAMGLPCVATSVGGIPETIENGINGLLVGAADVEALAAALNLLCTSSQLRTQFGDAAHGTLLSRFTVGRMVAETLALYGELLEAH